MVPGVVGLAICRALALEGQHVILLEAEKAVGTHTSSRNSEVIHSGAQRVELSQFYSQPALRCCGSASTATQTAQIEGLTCSCRHLLYSRKSKSQALH